MRGGHAQARKRVSPGTDCVGTLTPGFWPLPVGNKCLLSPVCGGPVRQPEPTKDRGWCGCDRCWLSHSRLPLERVPSPGLGRCWFAQPPPSAERREKRRTGRHSRLSGGRLNKQGNFLPGLFQMPQDREISVPTRPILKFAERPYVGSVPVPSRWSQHIHSLKAVSWGQHWRGRGGRSAHAKAREGRGASECPGPGPRSSGGHILSS